LQQVLERCEHWHVQPIDLLATLLPILHAFERLHVPAYLAGSIASFLHRMQQLARDIDLMVDLPEPAIAPLLKPDYVLDEDEIREAVRTRTSCSLIHLDSLMKVDVILPKREAFDTCIHQLVVQLSLDKNTPPIWLASVYEMILFKLRRYCRDEQSHTDGMRGDAEWNDVLGMLKVQATVLDLSLLEAWAAALDLTEPWRRVLIDTGLREV
jgi:hypothetical protein